MKRRCLGCRTLIAGGSYCARCGATGGPSHGPRPASPGRITGRRLQRRRAELIAQQAGRCAWCGAGGTLELHHIDHDHTNDSPANHVLICKSCHAWAGRRNPK